MKRLFTIAFLAAVLCAAAFAASFDKNKNNSIDITVHAEDTVAFVHPNSLTYIGNDRLIVADDQGIKEVNTKTGGRTLRFNFSDFGFSYTRNIAFDKETNVLYMEAFSTIMLDNFSPAVEVRPIYAYNEITGEYRTIADKAEIETMKSRNIFDEEITDIIGQTMADVGYTPKQTVYDITVDKYNRKIWYINIDVYSYPVIIDEEVPGWWSFEENPAVNSHWGDGGKPLQERDGGDLFYTANSNAVLYKYPSVETPRIIPISAGCNLILLNKNPEFCKSPTAAEPNPIPRSFGDTADGALDGWRLVLYEIGNTKYEVGYIQAGKLRPVTNYQISDLSNDSRAKSIVKFKAKSALLPNYYGRVIRYEVPIYKYPTCIINTLTVGSAKKTEQDSTNKLPLDYLIEITDTLNWHYFQIKVYDDSGTEKGIGFVSTNGIIDIAAEPEYPRVVPNAEIVAEDGEIIKIYKDADGTEELTEITLKKGAQIRIDLNKKSEDRYRRTAAYNKIYYNDPEIGEWWLIEGYVETKYIKPKETSLSPAQWIGLAMLGAVLIGVLAAFIIITVSNAKYEKNKRKLNETAAEELPDEI